MGTRSIRPGDAPMTRAWVGPAPGRGAIAASLGVGVYAMLIAGVAPVLLGALMAEHRLSEMQLGLAGTVEMLAMGVAAGVSGPLMHRLSVRPVAILSSIAVAAVNVGTLFSAGTGTILLRALAGVPSGILVGLITALIVRSPTPERWSGVYLTVQGVSQLMVATAIALFVLPGQGANGGFLWLAALGLLSAAVGMAVPRRFAPLAHGADVTPGGMPSPRGWMALLASFLLISGLLGVFIYMEPLARDAGLSPTMAGMSVAAALAGQVIGGGVATAVAGHVRWPAPLLGSTLLLLFITGWMMQPSSPALFMVKTAAFGFLWMFASPFFTSMTVDVEPARRAATLGSGALLLGCGTGPLCASWATTEFGMRGSLVLMAAFFGAGGLIAAGLYLTRGPRASIHVPS